jgi:hypothetical protein
MHYLWQLRTVPALPSRGRCEGCWLPHDQGGYFLVADEGRLFVAIRLLAADRDG